VSRLKTVFSTTPHKVLNIYLTAGYPELNSTLPLIRAVEEAGADIVELGMPYSDPLADGPVIQQSSAVAIANGMRISLLFEQLASLRPAVKLPVILMGYMNPVLQYGFEKFCAKAAEVGVDGLILPDLPEFEFESHYGPIIAKYGLDFIFLVTPETSEQRVRRLDQLSSGFLYAVSSSSTTGSDKDMATSQAYLDRLLSMKLKNPVLVGFGIRDRETFEQASASAAGAIIGSAFIKALGAAGDPLVNATQFVKSIKGGQ
jgi:tryptophan synthase alpha chain